MSQMRSQRPVSGARTAHSRRAGVYGTSALKNAYTSSNEAAAPRVRAQEGARVSAAPHRDYFESTARQQAVAAPKKREKVFSKSMIMLISLAAVVFVMGCMWIAQLASYMGLRGELETARAQLDALDAEVQVMDDHLETLKDGERIRTYAVNKLGMIAPGKGEERKISIILPRTQETVAPAQEEMHYTLLDVLVDMLWF